MSGDLRAIPARLFAPTDIAPLVAFRMAFGGLMFVEMLRSFAKGWIGPLYVEPVFHFSYPGFAWVRPLPGDGMTFVFAGLAACALLIALGAYYRLAAIGFCIGFSYVFLVEAARYQNHFYLICLISCLMIFVPAHRAASVDAWVHPEIRADHVSAWPLWLLRGQVAIVYLFAGLAKLNGDWLRGEPARQFLAERAAAAGLGPLGVILGHPWAPYVVSYGGLLVDLALIPLLLWRRTRLLALALAVLFHSRCSTPIAYGTRSSGRAEPPCGSSPRIPCRSTDDRRKRPSTRRWTSRSCRASPARWRGSCLWGKRIEVQLNTMAGSRSRPLWRYG